MPPRAGLAAQRADPRHSAEQLDEPARSSRRVDRRRRGGPGAASSTAPRRPAGPRSSRRPATSTSPLYSKDSIIARRNQLIQAAASSIAIQDRLLKRGRSRPATRRSSSRRRRSSSRPPIRTRKPIGPTNSEDFASSFAISFALSILLFMAIILYGQWVAFSVAEEKNSRVMEVVLAAATPFQLLTGKVVGVGGLALVQYVLVLVPASVVLIFQDQIACLAPRRDVERRPAAGPLDRAARRLRDHVRARLRAVRGALRRRRLAREPPGGRQPDRRAAHDHLGRAAISSPRTPGTGLIPIDSPLVVIASFIPFFSPYLMLTRLGQNSASPVEVVDRDRPPRGVHPRRALGRRAPLPLRRAPLRPATHAADARPGPPRAARERALAAAHAAAGRGRAAAPDGGRALTRGRAALTARADSDDDPQRAGPPFAASAPRGHSESHGGLCGRRTALPEAGDRPLAGPRLAAALSHASRRAPFALAEPGGRVSGSTFLVRIDPPGRSGTNVQRRTRPGRLAAARHGVADRRPGSAASKTRRAPRSGVGSFVRPPRRAGTDTVSAVHPRSAAISRPSRALSIERGKELADVDDLGLELDHQERPRRPRATRAGRSRPARRRSRTRPRAVTSQPPIPSSHAMHRSARRA